MMDKDNLENFTLGFMGVGFPKSGTTWVAECLREHPGVNFTKHKEDNFFLTNKLDLDVFFPDLKCTSWGEFMKEFDPSNNGVKGGFCAFYIYDVGAAMKMKEFFPDIKIIILLRNPADFLYSSYSYDKGSNASYQVPESFEKAVEDATESKRDDVLYNLEKAKYHKYIREYLEVFSSNQVGIFIYEEIVTNPEEGIKKIYEFIDVDTNFIPNSLNRKVNISKSIRSPTVAFLVRRVLLLLKKVGLKKVVYNIMFTDNKVKRLYEKVLKKPIKKDKMSEDFRMDLLNRLEPDTKILEEMIKKDLTAWRR